MGGFAVLRVAWGQSKIRSDPDFVLAYASVTPWRAKKRARLREPLHRIDRSRFAQSPSGRSASTQAAPNALPITAALRLLRSLGCQYA
jgi:hypothetical protein